MPNPGSFDSKSKYMKVCVPKMIKEGKKQDQAVAACLSMWGKAKKEFKPIAKLQYLAKATKSDPITKIRYLAKVLKDIEQEDKKATEMGKEPDNFTPGGKSGQEFHNKIVDEVEDITEAPKEISEHEVIIVHPNKMAKSKYKIIKDQIGMSEKEKEEKKKVDEDEVGMSKTRKQIGTILNSLKPDMDEEDKKMTEEPKNLEEYSESEARHLDAWESWNAGIK